MSWIIELEPDTWFARWTDGDPPRTHVRQSARVYETQRGAKVGLAYCRRFRPFANAEIVMVPTLAEQLVDDRKKGGE